MTAAVYNITINAHSDFSRTFQLTEDDVAVDLTDYSFAGSIREHHTSTDSVDFTTTVSDAAQGLYNISLTDVQTGAMTPGKYLYDIVMTQSDGKKIRLLQGEAVVKAGITR